MTKYLFIFLLIPILSFSQDSFRNDYTLVSIYNSETEEWGEWQNGYNTFVFNYNDNGDVLHILDSGKKYIYRKLSDGVEKEYTENGEHYQIITALDEEGIRFRLQLFDNPSIGLKMIYSNLMIQFSKP